MTDTVWLRARVLERHEKEGALRVQIETGFSPQAMWIDAPHAHAAPQVQRIQVTPELVARLQGLKAGETLAWAPGAPSPRLRTAGVGQPIPGAPDDPV